MASADINSEARQESGSFSRRTRYGHRSDRIADGDAVSSCQRAGHADLEPGIARVAPNCVKHLVSGGVHAGECRTHGQKIMQEDLAIIGALHKAGVPIVVGTDQNVPGFSVYREIELYHQAGFTPVEALQAATIVPARVMKVDAESGSVEVGKRADLDVLDASPLDDIHNVRTVRQVLANGVLYNPAPLWESVGFKPWRGVGCQLPVVSDQCG